MRSITRVNDIESRFFSQRSIQKMKMATMMK